MRDQHHRPLDSWRLVTSQKCSRIKADRFILTALAALSLSGCGPNILEPEGPIGVAEKSILIDSLAIMLAIVVPTILATIAFAWWYRASNTRARYLPDFEYSGSIEMVVWGIPLLVIMLLGGVSWIGSHQLDPARPLESKEKPIEVQVVSMDWKWLFIYPDQKIASLNQLVVPVGIPIHLSLTSASVMSAFFIPRLGSMIYTMNGMVTQLNLQADHTGVLHGLSSHFNGDGFSDMNFEAHVVSPEDFANWGRTGAASSPNLDADSYGELSYQSINVKPATFKLADPALFQSIVTQKLPPAPGPVPSISPKHEANACLAN